GHAAEPGPVESPPRVGGRRPRGGDRAARGPPPGPLHGTPRGGGEGRPNGLRRGVSPVGRGPHRTHRQV
ncbi:MAG: hypothetical protein AVDCRST_MAG19-3304, partial [uncultured Thermomicrobiales bacterium]